MVEDGKFTWAGAVLGAAGLALGGDADRRCAGSIRCQPARRGLMVPRRRGLIVNVSQWAAQKYLGNVIYGVSKAATDKLTADTAAELRDHAVTVASLYPGLVRTEAVLAAGVFDLSNSESPEFVGRAVAALAAIPTRSAGRARCS